eukprot:4009502-Pleurochrysis_carterae.AAC.2
MKDIDDCAQTLASRKVIHKSCSNISLIQAEKGIQRTLGFKTGLSIYLPPAHKPLAYSAARRLVRGHKTTR